MFGVHILKLCVFLVMVDNCDSEYVYLTFFLLAAHSIFLSKLTLVIQFVYKLLLTFFFYL